MSGWNVVRTALGVAIVLAACAAPVSVGTDRPSPSPDATPPASEGDDPMPSGLTGAVPEALLAEILADASERSGVPAEKLEIVTADAVTFNDGSLGCPQPGMFYTQALVDGYQVVVRTPDGELDYRAAQQGGFRLCENPVGPLTRSTEYDDPLGVERAGFEEP
jgi:hypothetical protein